MQIGGCRSNVPKHVIWGAPAPLLMLPLCSVSGSLWRQGVVGDLGIPSVPRCPPAQKESHTCVICTNPAVKVV